MTDYTMSARSEELSALLVVVMIFSNFALANVSFAFAASPGGKIDLFTQKEPHNGLGPNAPSDAFAPGEEVQISAYVNYNEYPVASLLVAFAISGPGNPHGNITLYRTAFTDEAGVAETEFRISQLNQTTFGEWKATGRTVIGDVMVQDTVTFEVGWIVKIVSAKTVNEQRITQAEFIRGDCVGVELVLRNIAMTQRNATLAVTMYDALGVRIDSTQIIDFAVRPSATLVTVYFFMHIPEDALVGNASICADAYTAPGEFDGVSYCPEVSALFSIIARRYFLSIRTDPIGVALIAGESWYEEYTTVGLIAPSIVSVSAGARYRFSHWDVDGVSISARGGMNSASILMNASHLATAHYAIQYFLTVKADPFGITTLAGEGWYDRDTNVTLSAPTVADHQFSYWDIDNVTLGNMIRLATAFMNCSHVATAHYTQTKYRLTIQTTTGGTTNPLPGTYVYNASSTAQVVAFPSTNYTFDHWELDGVLAGSVSSISVSMNQDHVLKAVFSLTPPKRCILKWFCWFLLFLLLIILLPLLALWFYRRRKKSRDSFHSGWTAWYYGYDRSVKSAR